jgi:hypothetical protein
VQRAMAGLQAVGLAVGKGASDITGQGFCSFL